MSLNRAQILGKVDFELKEIDVPEWGGSVFVRPFSVRLKDRIEQIQMFIKDYKGSPTAIALAGSICDEKGKLLFSEDDAKALSEKDAEVVGRIFKEIVALNGITEEDLEGKSKN